jgi:hypothetical protein
MLSIRDNADLWPSSLSMIFASLFCLRVQITRNINAFLGPATVFLTKASSSENVKTACVKVATRCSTLMTTMRSLDAGCILWRNFWIVERQVSISVIWLKSWSIRGESLRTHWIMDTPEAIWATKRIRPISNTVTLNGSIVKVWGNMRKMDWCSKWELWSSDSLVLGKPPASRFQPFGGAAYRPSQKGREPLDGVQEEKWEYSRRLLWTNSWSELQTCVSPLITLCKQWCSRYAAVA